MKRHTSIMVVDDEQAILTLLSRTLEQEGYDVVLAADGGSALTLLDNCKPNLVILDIMMPGFNGFQVLDLIRHRSSIPVIMLTGRCEVTTQHPGAPSSYKGKAKACWVRCDYYIIAMAEE